MCVRTPHIHSCGHTKSPLTLCANRNTRYYPCRRPDFRPAIHLSIPCPSCHTAAFEDAWNARLEPLRQKVDELCERGKTVGLEDGLRKELGEARRVVSEMEEEMRKERRSLPVWKGVGLQQMVNGLDDEFGGVGLVEEMEQNIG